MSTQALTCEVIDYSVHHTLGIRTHCAQKDLSAVIPQTHQKIAPYLAALGRPQTEAFYVAYFNMDMDNLEVEIGFITADQLPGKDEIASGTMGGGKAVSCLYVGSYRVLYQAHEAAHQFIAAKGYEHAEAAYEIYLNDPADTPEAELKTQVVVMIKG